MLTIWLFSILTAHGQSCLNLDGYGEGSCSYKSQKYGDFAGHISFQFQQNGCHQLSINGYMVSIPGTLNLVTQESGFTTRTVIQFRWHNAQKNSLKYDYEMITQNGSAKKDHVILQGQFTSFGSALILDQSGFVDSDAVRILCRLNR